MKSNKKKTAKKPAKKSAAKKSSRKPVKKTASKTTGSKPAKKSGKKTVKGATKKPVVKKATGKKPSSKKSSAKSTPRKPKGTVRKIIDKIFGGNKKKSMPEIPVKPKTRTVPRKLKPLTSPALKTKTAVAATVAPAAITTNETLERVDPDLQEFERDDEMPRKIRKNDDDMDDFKMDDDFKAEEDIPVHDDAADEDEDR